MVTCVYWEAGEAEGGQNGETMRWSEEGCWVAYSHKNYTVCSCSHLSTFALIMQIGEVCQLHVGKVEVLLLTGLNILVHFSDLIKTPQFDKWKHAVYISG